MTSLGVILCEESIVRIPEAYKRFLIPNSWKKLRFWREKWQITSVLEAEKCFWASGMRAIDFPHKITFKDVIFREKIRQFD